MNSNFSLTEIYKFVQSFRIYVRQSNPLSMALSAASQSSPHTYINMYVHFIAFKSRLCSFEISLYLSDTEFIQLYFIVNEMVLVSVWLHPSYTVVWYLCISGVLYACRSVSVITYIHIWSGCRRSVEGIGVWVQENWRGRTPVA